MGERYRSALTASKFDTMLAIPEGPWRYVVYALRAQRGVHIIASGPRSISCLNIDVYTYAHAAPVDK